MKKCIRLFSLLLVCITLFVFSACNSDNGSDLPNLDESSVVMRYGDFTINEKEFMYILTNVKTEFVFMYEYYYGYGEEQLMELSFDGVPAEEFIKEQAVKRAQKLLVLEKLAADSGITISNQEDLDMISGYIADIEYAYGGKDLFDVELVKFGFTREGIERVAKNALLEELILENRYGEDGVARIPTETVTKEFLENYIAYEAGAFSYVNESAAGYIKYDFKDDEILDFYKNNYVKVRHILYNKDKKSEAEGDLQKLKENKITFSDLIPKNMDNNEEYVFTYGKMVEPFEKASFEMAIGDIRLVETEYGYHIVEKLELDTTVLDKKNDTSSSNSSAKDEVILEMSKDRIRNEARSLIDKLKNGELKDFPEKVENFSNYSKITKNFINKNSSSYKDRLDVISKLNVGEYGEYDSKTEGIYIYKRVDFSEKDISSEIYTEIENAFIGKAFEEYCTSYFDSISIDNAILNKFDVLTIPLLEEDFYLAS